ncbi:MAG: hypothetical protein LBV33_01980, partial [Lachnospiraceae bacterium]|nr:hypothetical protein [Lachnospiraceae bacterium]
MSDIYLQLQRTSPFGNVSHGGAIIFDDLPKIQSEDIQYIPSAGMVMLEKPGTYLVDWSVAGYSSNGVVVGLYTSTPQGITLSDSINSGDHVSGSAIVVVTDASYVMLQLTNQATDDLVFTDVPIAASLVVYANISDGESTGDGGGSVKSKISLPFSSGFGPTCYPSLDANGFLTRASIIGNGQSNDIPINFAVSGGTIIQIPFGVDRSQYLFSFPYNVRLVAASAIFNNRSNLLL